VLTDVFGASQCGATVANTRILLLHIVYVSSHDALHSAHPHGRVKSVRPIVYISSTFILTFLTGNNIIIQVHNTFIKGGRVYYGESVASDNVTQRC
jgi:hypothetical protein